MQRDAWARERFAAWCTAVLFFAFLLLAVVAAFWMALR